MEEPSVLDLLLSRLKSPRGQQAAAQVSAAEEGEALTAAGAATILQPAGPEQGGQPSALNAAAALPARQPARTAASLQVGVWPWRSLLAFGLAVVAQLSLEPSPQRAWTGALLLYLLAFAFLALAYWRGEWQFNMAEEQGDVPVEAAAGESVTLRIVPLGAALILLGAAFLAFGGNQFTRLNVTLWLAGSVLFVAAFWTNGVGLNNVLSRARDFVRRVPWRIALTPGAVAIVAALALAAFFRYYRLEQVPPEMVSDQAEKLLDIWDVMQGQTSIFFPRNTGREAFQMYLTAAVIQIFGTGFSFLSMKIGTATAGMFTLPFIYLLGKEVGSPRAGLLAMTLAGIAYWPNVIARIGLRFALYPLFVAPTLYFLVRGIRRKNLNDFILSGIALGIGLHGYTPIRILPFVVVIAVGLYLLHRQSIGRRSWAVWGLALLSLAALVIFIPLLRYALENPEMFVYRSFTRLGTLERAYPEPVWVIFVKNLWSSMTMMVWDNGDIWVHSVTHRPALDWITAALFTLGFALVTYRYVRRRHWLDLFLLISFPLLMMPSILSLAFPGENPSLNRSGGAYVPVFILAGLALDGLMNVISDNVRPGWRAVFAWGVASILLLGAVRQNYDLVFNQYYDYYKRSSWNTSEMGKLIRNFADSVGTPDSAWVMGFPHWVDTRLVGLNAGYPTKDYALFPEQIPDTMGVPGPKMFLLRPDDSAAMDALRQAYPLGTVSLHPSSVEGHEFLVYFVPP